MSAGAPRARIHLTGAGGWGILTCLAIGAAAANTANNLLYLMLGLLLAAYVTSAWASRRSLARLDAEVVAPAETRPGAEADCVVTLSSVSGRAAAIVLELRAVERGAAAKKRVPAALPMSIPVVSEGEPVSVSLPATLHRRGPARLQLLARSPFPFGLIEGLRAMADEEILVLPAPDASWRQAVAESGFEGEPLPRKGEGGEMFNIRDYAWGEDARRMDWKATARLGRPMLREHALEQQRSVTIVLPSLDAAHEADAERAISRAAGAAEELHRQGWQLRLLAPGAEARGDDRALLRALARLQVPGQAPQEGWWRSSVSPGESVLLLDGAPREAA